MLVHDDHAAVRRVVPKRALATRSVRASRSMATRHGSDARVPRRPALPLAALVLGVYGAHTHGAQLALGLLLIAATAASGQLWKRRLWERPVLGRLEAWQTHDPRNGEVPVAIANADVRRACVALMHAQLYSPYGRSNPLPPAPRARLPLGGRVAFDRAASRVRGRRGADQGEALRRADIRARVVGIDVS